MVSKILFEKGIGQAHYFKSAESSIKLLIAAGFGHNSLNKMPTIISISVSSMVMS